MKNFKLMAIVALIAMSLGLTACNSGGDDDNKMYYSNVVTYEGSAGGMITFSRSHSVPRALCLPMCS